MLHINVLLYSFIKISSYVQRDHIILGKRKQNNYMHYSWWSVDQLNKNNVKRFAWMEIRFYITMIRYTSYVGVYPLTPPYFIKSTSNIYNSSAVEGPSR